MALVSCRTGPSVPVAGTPSGRLVRSAFCGPAGGVAERLVASVGSDFVHLEIHPLRGGDAIRWLRGLANLPLGLVKSDRLLRLLNPDLVVGSRHRRMGQKTLDLRCEHRPILGRMVVDEAHPEGVPREGQVLRPLGDLANADDDRTTIRGMRIHCRSATGNMHFRWRRQTGDLAPYRERVERFDLVALDP